MIEFVQLIDISSAGLAHLFLPLFTIQGTSMLYIFNSLNKLCIFIYIFFEVNMLIAFH